MTLIRASYQRGQDTDWLCLGSISVEGVTVLEFRRLAFSQLISLLHIFSKDAGPVTIFVDRTDRPGMDTVALDDALVGLIQRDPVAAIRILSPTDNPIPRKEAGVFYAGEDNASNYMGEDLYLRTQDGKVECFGCGSWVHNYCDTCRLPMQATPGSSGRWSKVKAKYLLSVGLTRYFLPRGWNPTAPWVAHAELTRQYSEWMRIRGEINGE